MAPYCLPSLTLSLDSEAPAHLCSFMSHGSCDHTPTKEHHVCRPLWAAPLPHLPTHLAC